MAGNAERIGEGGAASALQFNIVQKINLFHLPNRISSAPLLAIRMLPVVLKQGLKFN